jgi:hypothetical protein
MKDETKESKDFKKNLDTKNGRADFEKVQTIVASLHLLISQILIINKTSSADIY